MGEARRECHGVALARHGNFALDLLIKRVDLLFVEAREADGGLVFCGKGGSEARLLGMDNNHQQRNRSDQATDEPMNFAGELHDECDAGGSAEVPRDLNAIFRVFVCRRTA